jgi:hypothetical protein
VESGEATGGYLVRVTLPLEDAAKNRALGFDIRIYDRDGEAPAAWATWRFDPRREGAEPLLEDFGKLVLGAPMLDLLERPGPSRTFPVADGDAEVEGSWSKEGVAVLVSVADDAFEDGDRVEVWFDLANGAPPAPEPTRFFLYAGERGADYQTARGDSVDGMTDRDDSVSAVDWTEHPGGYTLALTVPWPDLGLVAGEPQRGWFLGMEVRVTDTDAQGQQIFGWSDSAGLRPELWPELRLFTTE